jgi:HSP20 family molecular chaperone IbpA
MRRVGPLIVALIILTPRLARSRSDDLPVYVKETPSQAELQIQLPATVDPGSVEVQLVGREVTVVARDSKTGREVRSRTLRLEGPAVESGALAEYEGEGWLAVKLPKRTLESETD